MDGVTPRTYEQRVAVSPDPWRSDSHWVTNLGPDPLTATLEDGTTSHISVGERRRLPRTALVAVAQDL